MESTGIRKDTVECKGIGKESIGIGHNRAYRDREGIELL